MIEADTESDDERITTDEKHFDIGDVLSVTTDWYLSRTGGVGLYELIHHMTGKPVYTHQLSRVVREKCRPALLALYPELGEPMATGFITTCGENAKSAVISAWLSTAEARFGKTLPIPKLPAEVHQPIDPVDEMIERLGEDRVIVVNSGAP